MQTLADIKKEIKHLDPKLGADTEAYRAACVILSALVVGADRTKLSMFTGESRGFIYGIERRLRSCGIWVGKKTKCEWFEKKSGTIAFWCDVNVALGYLRRSNRPVAA